jgi:hypothetical protein
VAYKQGFLDRPIVDEYALILGEWLKLLLPNWKPEKLHFTVRLSHDIDYIGRFSSTGHALRVLVGDVIKRRNIRQTRQTAADWWQQTVMPQHTLQMQGIYRLAQLSKENGLCSAFYFMTADHGPYDTGYDSTSSVVRQCIEDLLNQGHEVGFHPGYHTFDDLECLATEKARLDKLLGTTKYGGRQHVLRFQVPITWRHWAQVGLTYDSTLGFADYEGFRCGTCHPFQPFDLIENGQLKLWEIPLITMDTTLRFYRRLTPAEGETQILKLARHCKRVNGTFTLLWHNSSLNQDWYPWAVIYERTVRTLAKMQY